MDRDFGLGGLSDPSFSIPEPVPHPSSRDNDYNVHQLLEQAIKNSGVLSLQGNKQKADIKDLIFIEDIGHGSCGTVGKCSYKGVIMAVKIMPRTKNSYEMSRILMDLDVICLSFDCPYIVRCFGYFITPTDVRVCMECMATCLDRLLIHIRQPIPERIIGKLSISIIKALHYLKTKHQIMHRDVKPSNILLDWSGVIKLCDFGIAGRLIESRAHSKQAGCPLYMGPERLDPSNTNSYDIRSDVWSLGLTLVELATGQYPYAGSEFEMLAKIVHGEPPRLRPGNFTPEFCDLVEKCLQREPNLRPNYNELLQHPFILFHEQQETDVEEWFADVMGV
uniref:mitogen-activated protein kinase kinase n=1 Tax=Caenorhabditis japonica TaxID=281687 RepID=A0A8R1DSG1_CAEJA